MWGGGGHREVERKDEERREKTIRRGRWRGIGGKWGQGRKERGHGGG